MPLSLSRRRPGWPLPTMVQLTTQSVVGCKRSAMSRADLILEARHLGIAGTGDPDALRAGDGNRLDERRIVVLNVADAGRNQPARAPDAL